MRPAHCKPIIYDACLTPTLIYWIFILASWFHWIHMSRVTILCAVSIRQAPVLYS